MATMKLRRSWPVIMQTLVQGRHIITGSRTEQSREERHANTEKKRSKTQKKRYPGMLGTPDEYWRPMYSDCDRHADGKSAWQYCYGGDFAGKSAWQYSYGDDSAGVISKL